MDAPDHADHALKQRLDAEWQNLTRRLEEAVAGLRKEGIEVKDLESGLVDFYGLQDGEIRVPVLAAGRERGWFLSPARRIVP